MALLAFFANVFARFIAAISSMLRTVSDWEGCPPYQ
jgi:hypothetical protein